MSIPCKCNCMLILYIHSGFCKGRLLGIPDGDIDMHPCDWPSHGCASVSQTQSSTGPIVWSLRWCVSSTDKATHPTNRQEDWEYIIGFCDQINKELEG